MNGLTKKIQFEKKDLLLRLKVFLVFLFYWTTLFIVICLLFNKVISFILLKMNSIESIVLLNLSGAIFFIFILFYLLAQGKLKIWLDANQGFLVVVGIWFTVIIYLLDNSVYRLTILASDIDYYNKTEKLLILENSSNLKSIGSMVTDLENDPTALVWSDFSVQDYEKYTEHFIAYYTPECQNKYGELKLNLDAINKLNKMKREGIYLYDSTRADLTGKIILFSNISKKILGELESCSGTKIVTIPRWFPLPEGITFKEKR